MYWVIAVSFLLGVAVGVSVDVPAVKGAATAACGVTCFALRICRLCIMRRLHMARLNIEEWWWHGAPPVAMPPPKMSSAAAAPPWLKRPIAYATTHH